MIMEIRPQVSKISGSRELWTVWIHQVVLAKLSYAVLPSRAATTPTAPRGGDHELRPASGLTSLIVPSTRRQGESWATVLAYASSGSAAAIQRRPKMTAPMIMITNQPSTQTRSTASVVRSG